MSNWIDFTPVSGNGNATITITASTLSSLNDRVAQIVATNSQYSLSSAVTITQQAAPTAITFSNVSWTSDIPATGGTASKDNCTYQVLAVFYDGTSANITSSATVSGSFVISATSSYLRTNVGSLNLVATYGDLVATTSVTAYQAAPSITGIVFTSLSWVVDVPSSGGTADSDNCYYTITSNYDAGLTADITSLATVSGTLIVPSTTANTRESVGTLTLTASYSGFSTSSAVTAYQSAYIPVPAGALQFNISSSGTINWLDDGGLPRTIKYSKDNGSTWIDITSTSTGSTINVSSGDTVLFIGDNNEYSLNALRSTFSGSTAKFSIEGNIMSLINSTGFTSLTTLPSNYTFEELFAGCTGLTSAEDLELPAVALTKACYAGMFYGCTSLTKLPELPASVLAEDCYNGMFDGCISLTTVPSNYLTVEYMATRCYAFMFANCTNLISAPSLNSTNLAGGCYHGMFEGCTSLATAPILPATDLYTECYRRMFFGCSSLTAAPELPAPDLVRECYEEMFAYCGSLNYIKCLAEDNSATECVNNWVYFVQTDAGTFIKDPFASWSRGDSGIPYNWEAIDSDITGITISGLTWVTDVPASGGTANKDNCSYTIYATHSSGEVNDVTSKSSISGTLVVPATTSITRDNVGTLTLTASYDAVYSAFTTSGNVSVYQEAYIPPIPPTPTPTGTTEYLTFNILSAGTINWKAPYYDDRKTISYSLDNGSTWTSLTPVEYVGASINVGVGDVVKFKGDNSLYSGNTFSASTASFSLEGNIMSLVDSTNFSASTTISTSGMFKNLFNGCSGLISAENLVLPATALTSNCYENMFSGCTNMVSAPELPATDLGSYCYSNMFRDCTSLTKAPSIIPSMTLAVYCCYYMFYGCTSLTTAPDLPATTLVNSCYFSMFRGCSNLNSIKCLATNISASNCTGNWVNGVSGTGNFIKNPNMSSWTTGNNGIPSGWTVTDLA